MELLSYLGFSFPIEDNEVHDNIVECSNMGICDIKQSMIVERY